jgi:hypothetical protein
MKVIRFPRTEHVTANTVHYWCRCHLRDGFRVRHDTGIGKNEKRQMIWMDHITIKTFSERDFVLATRRWCENPAQQEANCEERGFT